MIKVSDAAQQYLKQLLEQQKQPGIAVRMFVTNPGTNEAETCLSYCRVNEELPSDKLIEFPDLRFFIDASSEKYLTDASIEYEESKTGGEIVIKAPNAKQTSATGDSVVDQITAVLETDVNPGLAQHGGFARLIKYDAKEQSATLAFGGGCQGCSQIDVTVKGYVEKTLLEKIPELKSIKDATDHSDLSHAYY